MNIDNVKISYGRCLAYEEFFDYFFDRFFESHPSVKEMFAETDFPEQKKHLRHGLNLVIMFASDNLPGQLGLNRIKDTHGKTNLNIRPEFYPLWKESLMKAVVHFDKDITEELKAEWGMVLDKGIEFIAAGYEA